ncbi:ribosomal protein [Hirsutella rhossiliensis]|uniref:Ribosomal protein l7Ae/L30e/S12e/Gadd45 family domain-containing protein n=1 Tax=Hirsutella rhossiliensis TaxID=111463 RepID=A0A9P8SE93_9HYPO|nr:ribosomal protein l7Ae/L30e/S12e/Gadd45 family domain-containing protein [Hirsutella rhossiliensis]KAH0959598.1 ribosomal protein l7Ae/L30e/S12e/Gadd45 family domain-containing protein [Hirsutella rhossiliensis]
MAAERPEKKDKKDKKEKRSEEAGVSKAKKDKKDKRDKKDKLAAAVEGSLQLQDAASPLKAKAADADDDTDMEGQDVQDAGPLERTVVPFAVPVADEKGMKKVYKTIRKAAKNGTLKRGVKEVVKALRKSPPSAPGYTSFPGLVVIAGDISPQDVISHLPVLCEDHNVPFIFVTSRAELGASAKTKRPTSVVMIMEKLEAAAKKKQQAKDADKDKDAEGEADEAFAESYASLVKYVQKEYARQAFWAKGESKA